jgi:gamma-glutamylcyclotransferase (GGCT)/AIG2-like uncharacterized protein YtfP
MDDELCWWQESLQFLNENLPFINTSRSCDEAIGRCEALCKALNKAWNAFYQYRSISGALNERERENDAAGNRSDTQSFREFVLHGIDNQRLSDFCESESLLRLAELSPQIMNHNTLLRQQYDPLNITDDVRKKASDQHRQLLNALKRFTTTPEDQSLRETLLKKTATLVYVVRSNIAHSEKTPHGPDRSKSERDQIVSEVTATVIEDMFDNFFERPSNRLAVYGTLIPGGANASELAGLEGEWLDGTVSGKFEDRDGFLEFHWLLQGTEVPVKIFSGNGLREQLDRLDQFEGPRYRRILVPVLIEGTVHVSNIYEGMPPCP